MSGNYFFLQNIVFKNLILIIIWGMNTIMLQHFLDYSGKLTVFIFLVGLMVILRFRKKLYICIVPPIILVALLIWLFTIQASNDRDWRLEVSNLPRIEINNDDVTIHNLRNAIWHEGRVIANWESRNYDLNKLSSLDLIVEPFNDSKLMAHTMLDFGFEDQGHVIVSIEARKEIYEEYSLVAGALRQFELIYIFGDEKDLLTLRALVRGSALHLYPIQAEPEFITSLFKDLAKSANTLHDEPKFYRTLRDNCTTTLVEHIDRQYQEKIGTRMETIFPAKAGRLLHELGRMDTNLSYQQAHEVSRIDHLIVKYRDEDKNFSSLIHADSELAYGKQ